MSALCESGGPAAKVIVERLQDFIEKSVGPRRVFAHVLDHHRQLDTWSSERARPWHRKAQPGCRVVARRPGPAPA